jgi:hypothetical protein
VLHARIDSQAVTIFVGTELGQQPLARIDFHTPAVGIALVIRRYLYNLLSYYVQPNAARARVSISKHSVIQHASVDRSSGGHVVVTADGGQAFTLSQALQDFVSLREGFHGGIVARVGRACKFA